VRVAGFLARLYVLFLAAPAMCQTPVPLENAPPVHLGESETQVRTALNVHSPLYPAPFSSGRLTLKVSDGVFVDFQGDKVVEIDVTNRSADIRLGSVTMGSDLATAKSELGIANGSSSSSSFDYVAQGGEVVEMRSGADQHIAVFAVIGDRTHPPQRSTTSRIILQNSGKNH